MWVNFGRLLTPLSLAFARMLTQVQLIPRLNIRKEIHKPGLVF